MSSQTDQQKKDDRSLLGGLLGAFTWRPKDRAYINAKGRIVPWSAVRDALEPVAEGIADGCRNVTRALLDGGIDLPEWQEEMARLIRVGHVIAGEAAIGGEEEAKKDKKGFPLWIATRVKPQYQYLTEFARQLHTGEAPLSAATVARAAMYANATRQAFEALRQREDARIGYTEERRYINSSHPCADCPEYAAMGWQKVGVLPRIGEACACGGACKCSFERRRVVLHVPSRNRRVVPAT